MFTGIVEVTGKVVSLQRKKSNLTMGVRAPFAKKLRPGQSVAHNGVCLTVEKIFPAKNTYLVTAVKETLSKTNLGKLKEGDEVNLERSLRVGDPLDGHFVQGHVDATATVLSVKKEKGSWIFKFAVGSRQSPTYASASAKAAAGKAVGSLIINKGSICVNGVSLTVVEAKENIFSVAIIPHTYAATNFKSLKKGSLVNIEFDILGKHIEKILSSRGK